MRVLLLGATGLIGSAIAARLVRDGHEVVGVARKLDALARRVPALRWIELDLRAISGPEDWRPHLTGVDAVVNAAGTLQDSVRDSTARVHADAPASLWSACQEAGVRRIVHLSAMGVDRETPTRFSRTKRSGDAALEASGLDWVILRPSVVVGRPAYGGSALFRGLASLPFAVRIEDAGPLDIVQLDDVVVTVARLLGPEVVSRVALELSGPERMQFGEVVAAYRQWLGWRPAQSLRVPGFLMAAMWKLGDLIAWFGWRPPIRSTARREIARGATGDSTTWREATGIEPQPLGAALAANPASVQERWFARLYLMKPVAYLTFLLFWFMTGVVALTVGWDRAVRTMVESPAAPVAELTVIAGSLADFAVAGLLAFRRTARLGLIAAIGVSIAYIVSGTILRPDLWADPLGPMMKVWPILALNLVLLAILDER
jgi:uncharacterized protein YbjT (DUF2867 family)